MDHVPQFEEEGSLLSEGGIEIFIVGEQVKNLFTHTYCIFFLEHEVKLKCSPGFHYLLDWAEMRIS